MRFAVETWAPDYGASVDGAGLVESDAAVDVSVEREASRWSALAPTATPAGCVLFVDGVQRIDAWVWITADDGQARQGVCASWAAGVVRCDGRARVVAAEVRRGVLCAGSLVDAIATRHGDYRSYPVPVTSGDPVSQALGRARGDLEGKVAVGTYPAAAAGSAGGGGTGVGVGPGGAAEGRAAEGRAAEGRAAEGRAAEGRAAEGRAAEGRAADLLVVDGPLGDRRHVPGAVGYVKTHHVAYLPLAQQRVATRLRAGERTPLFAIGDRRFRYSWYLRLPGVATHPWWGVVRCEASGDLVRSEAVALADRVTATLPRFASQPHNDPRAPQNLHPIAGLERELRRRLGDPAIMERALRRAATAVG